MSAKGVEEARPITVTDTAADIYSDSQYLANNPDWHLADTAWKAREIANILERNNVVWRDAVEVGCGSRGIVGKLAAQYPGRPIHGYDISEDAAKLWPLQKASGAIFHHEDFLATKSVHDLVMLIDVFEHVEDYMGFLRALRPHGRYHVFHIPLDLHVQGLVRRAYMHARQKAGHLHYFTRETALATLEDTGYTVVDWHFTDVAGEANVVGTEIVLDAAEKAGVGTVVLASSGAVYDWVDAPLDEDATRTWPCDNYALSKLTNESQLRFWADRTGGRGRVARIFNTIGHDDPNAHLIPDILNQLYNAKGQARIALGNLKPRRDYIHAEDTAAGVAALAGDTGEASFDVMNIGSGRDASVEELVRLIGAAMKVDIEIVEDKARLRRVDRATQLAKVDKIGNRVGWSAKIELPAAVADIVRGFPFKKAG
ncbi:NAD-dependent epimerase/dehydratase family protein [Mesorhizobium sp. M1163]|uniref:NAD-dependent epimerase/dehydratase family protein n=2 Tax=unclassified Mesorhizobium TaxID=325217 RepID=UPI0033369DBC